MKRYLLFQYDSCYPAGRWGDMKGDYDSALEAYSEAATDYDNTEVIDSQTGEPVEDPRNDLEP